MTIANVANAALIALTVSAALGAEGAKEIKCSRIKSEPRLDYEFRMAARQRIRVPAEPFAGDESVLKLKTTVRAVQPPGSNGAAPAEPVITIQRTYRKPPVPDKTDQFFQFGDSLAFGEGTYQAEWSLQAPDGRSCRVTWTIDATRGRKLRHLPSPLAPGEAVNAAAVMYHPEDSVIGEHALRLKVFLNLDPPQRQRPVRARPPQGPQGGDISGPRGGRGGSGGGRGGGFGGPRGRGRGARGERNGRQRASLSYGIGVLRSLSRDPRIGEVSLVAYSVEDRETVLRHGFAPGFDFPALRGIRQELDPNTVDLGDLDPESDNRFFGEMLVREMAEDAAADLYIFLGADAQIGERPPQESLRQIGEPAAPVFYLNNTRGVSWSGLVENSIKHLGGKELNVQSPEDLWKAITKMLGPRDGS